VEQVRDRGEVNDRIFGLKNEKDEKICSARIVIELTHEISWREAKATSRCS